MISNNLKKVCALQFRRVDNFKKRVEKARKLFENVKNPAEVQLPIT